MSIFFDVLALIGFTAFIFYYSHEIWTNPNTYLEKIRKTRETRIKGSPSNSQQMIVFTLANYFDKHPNADLWLGRSGWILMYAGLGYAIFEVIKNQ